VTPNAALAEAKKGSLRPVYLIAGEERLLREDVVRALREAALGAGIAAFNEDKFTAGEVDVEKIIAAARTLPMMAPRRLVVAKGIDGVKADDLAPLAEYAKEPSPEGCLVLVGEKVDTRFKAFQVLRKAGYLHEFAPLRDRELGGWITREARARKITISSEAVAALAESAGPELARLSMALEQLALFVGARASITLEDVEALVPETRQRSVFELTRAIGEGDVTRALRTLANMFRNREPPLRVQFMLARQLRQIWRAKELAATGAGRDEIAQAVGVPPFFLDDVLTPARRMSNRTLARGFERLYQADRALKSSRVDGELLLSRLVEQLSTDARGPAPAR